MKRWLAMLLVCSPIQQGAAQIKFLEKVIRNTLAVKDSSRNHAILVLPVLSYAQETGLEVGASGVYSFYSNKTDLDTRVSSLLLFGTINTKKGACIGFKADYWHPRNRYHCNVDIVYYTHAFIDFYGIGNEVKRADKNPLIQDRLKAILKAEKLLRLPIENFYVGLVLDLEHYQFKDRVVDGIFAKDASIIGKQGGSSLFYGPSFIYDTRDVNTYTRKGFYANLNAGLIAKINTAGHRGSFLNLDIRQFYTINRPFTIALQHNYNGIFGRMTPFYLLNRLGNDQIMRGYYAGYYRDKNLLAIQSELRYRLSDRISIVGFIGTGTVFRHTLNFRIWKPNYGGGLRYFFDVEKGSNIRLDYGFGTKGQSGFYISFGEAF